MSESTSKDHEEALYVSISFPSSNIDLSVLARLVTNIDSVFWTLAKSAALQAQTSIDTSSAEQAEPTAPEVVELTKGSFTMQLLATTAIALPSLKALGFVIRDPAKIGSFLPKIKSGFYDAEAEAIQARARLEELRQLGGEPKVRMAKQRIKSKQAKTRSQKNKVENRAKQKQRNY